jgi:hypothetical protein
MRRYSMHPHGTGVLLPLRVMHGRSVLKPNLYALRPTLNLYVLPLRPELKLF